MILIFSIAMGAEYLSYMKFIATEAPTFFGYIISVLASVKALFRWALQHYILQKNKALNHEGIFSF